MDELGRNYQRGRAYSPKAPARGHGRGSTSPQVQHPNPNYDGLSVSDNKGIRTLFIEVALTASGTIFQIPDQPVLKGKRIVGLETFCATTGTPPTSFVPVPKTPNGNTCWNIADMEACFIQFNDDKNTAIMDRESATVFCPSINNGIQRNFSPPMIGVVWTQCRLYFGSAPSGTVYALLMVRYLPD